MKAEIVRDGLLVDGVTFHRFDIGIRWLNPRGHDHFAQHWLAVVGQTLEFEYWIYFEASGALSEIAESAVDAKDRFLVERVWIDPTQLSSAAYMQEWDGLTQYKVTDKKDLLGKPKYLNPPERWPHFRGRDEDRFCAMLCAVPEIIRNDPQAGIDLVVHLINEGRLVIRKWCPQSVWVTGAQLPEMLEHPLMSAIAWPLMMLENEKALQGKNQDAHSPRYGNLKR